MYAHSIEGTVLQQVHPFQGVPHDVGAVGEFWLVGLVHHNYGRFVLEMAAV